MSHHTGIATSADSFHFSSDNVAFSVGANAFPSTNGPQRSRDPPAGQPLQRRLTPVLEASYSPDKNTDGHAFLMEEDENVLDLFELDLLDINIKGNDW